MKLLKCILTANDCYKTGRIIKPKGVMVHSTGANNPLLKRYVQPVASTPGRAELLEALGTNLNANHWNRAGTNACVHAFIGRLVDGSVAAVQTLPWNWRGWHAGTGTSGKSANDTHISFEICEDDLINPDYFRRAYRGAVELTAMLCKEYSLDPLADGVVICHQDGYKRGIASNHGDVYNWFPNSNMMAGFNAANVVALQNANALQSQISGCCCDLRTGQMQTQNAIERGFCQTDYKDQANTNAIIQNAHSDTDRIIARLDAMERNQDKAKIAEQAAEIQAYKQNAAFGAMISASEANILRRTGAECPTAAYIVQPPQPVSFATNCSGQAVFNNGWGNCGSGYGNNCGGCGC